MTQYPKINTDGAMLALRLKLNGKLDPNPLAGLPPRDHASTWNAERLAHECSELVRLARRHTAIQVKRCNQPTGEREDTAERRLRERIQQGIEALVPKCRRHGLLTEFHGDPRGHTVTLSWDSFTTWGLA